MAKKNITINVYRFDPELDLTPRLENYVVPFEPGMSAMDTLDYIYQNLDNTLAYYDHAGCTLGICGKCIGKINGRPGLFCQTAVTGDILLEPLSKKKILKDLVPDKKSMPEKAAPPTNGNTD